MSKNNSLIDASKKPVDFDWKKAAAAADDWHTADIIAAIRKRGTSLQREARLRGYYATTLHGALDHPYPKAEAIIAEIIGVSPQAIWPSRYHSDGTPRSGRGQRGLGRYKNKDSTGNHAVNVHNRKAA